MGIHPDIVKWLGQFLKDRTFQVRVGNALSSNRSITSGVPQGGVLSPILFNIYTCELPKLIRGFGIGCKMFADDLKIYGKSDDLSCQQSIQDPICSISQWSKC